MSTFFHSPDAQYRAERIKQMLNQVGEYETYARPDGQVLMGTRGHFWLFDLNELGQLHKVDDADIVRPTRPNVVEIQ